MDTLLKYKHFAKTKNTIAMTDNAVIYTRVSSKEQAEGNASLDTQLKYCKEFASKKGYNIVEYFGGTYESAKSDERKEFNKMLTYLKRRKNISYIIVYSYDRFSRTGANAAYISSNLKKRGIHTVSVSQEVDTSKPSGVFQENLYYMFSQFDNELRKDKTITGMREKLRNGHWCFSIPFGYDKVNKGSTADKGILILNDKGKMIKKAFKWINKYGWSVQRTSDETKKYAQHITMKRLSAYLRNPFYAGIITSYLIPNEVYEGKHEKAVSVDVFNKVNEILNGKSSTRKGIKNTKNSNNTPLKGFVKCDECGGNITGYLASKNKKYYYKCNTKGCKNNQNAEQMHESFKEILGYFQIDKKYIEPLKYKLKEDFLELSKETLLKKQALTSKLRATDNKLEMLEEKFIFNSINEDIYHKHLSKLSNEKNEILKELEKPEIKLSNLDKFIDFSTKISTNLLNVWNKQNYEQRVNIQNLVFPEGIRYNRKKQHYRTQRINSMFSLNNLFSETYKDKKQKGQLIFDKLSLKVNPEGFEPPTSSAVTRGTIQLCYGSLLF